MTRNKTWLLFTTMIFATMVSLDSDVFLDDSQMVLVNILSQHDKSINDATVQVYSYDDGEVSSALFDVGKSRYQSLVVGIDAQETPDYEPVRVVIRDNDVNEVKHVWTWVG